MPQFADWVIEGELAAMCRPDPDGLRDLKQAGFGLVINLTEDPEPTIQAAAAGLRAVHMPFPDMTAPTLNQMRDFVATVEHHLRRKQPIAVHCLAGLGRTGTMIACYLVKQGMAPWPAIDEVRRCRRGAIQTFEQEAAVISYARRLRENTPDP